MQNFGIVHFMTRFVRAGLLGVCSLLLVSPTATAAEQSPLPLRMRGMNTPIHGLEKDTEATIARLAKWGVNTIRINFGQDSRGHREIVPDPPTKENPLAPYRRNLKVLDRVLESCAKHHIGVILAAAEIYGRKFDYFWEKADGLESRAHLLAFWNTMAPLYKDNPTIVAFELLNEPNFKRGNEDIWRKQMLPQTLTVVRKHAKTKWIVVGIGPWGWGKSYGKFKEDPSNPSQLAWGWMKSPEAFKPLSDPRIIYTYHYYTPKCYTYQGVWGFKKKFKRGRDYPGTYHEYANPNGTKKHWSIESIRADAQIAKSFCDKYNVRMIVGEFSVIRWAPHGDRYLADCIKVFEEMGFDWLYQTVGGYNGWNLTFDADDPVSMEAYGGKNTARLKVLLKGWQRNRQ